MLATSTDEATNRSSEEVGRHKSVILGWWGSEKDKKVGIKGGPLPDGVCVVAAFLPG